MRILSAVVVLLALALPMRARAAVRHVARVMLVEGRATAHTGAQLQPLARGDGIAVGTVVETAASARLELRFTDGSVVRLAPGSELRVEEASFGRSRGVKKIRLRLLSGRLWTDVVKLKGAGSHFQVVSEHAVAGVRGTTFRVDARTDRSVLVRVYAGTVAVASAVAMLPEHGQEPPPERQQVKPPSQVSRDEWERIVSKQMQVTVEPDGTPGAPTAFADADDTSDAWAMWNRQRDAAIGRP